MSRNALDNWPRTHRMSEAEYAQREREEGRRHKIGGPWSWLKGAVPGGTGSPSFPEKKTLA